jgi:hypothetical protein
VDEKRFSLGMGAYSAIIALAQVDAEPAQRTVRRFSREDAKTQMCADPAFFAPSREQIGGC